MCKGKRRRRARKVRDMLVMGKCVTVVVPRLNGLFRCNRMWVTAKQCVHEINRAAMEGRPLYDVDGHCYLKAEITDIGEVWARRSL